MLYMAMSTEKTRVTFRIDPSLAEALRQISNQTAFVETALLAALGETCPLCDGRGKVRSARLAVSDFKKARLPRLRREGALRVRELVKLGQRLMATELRLTGRSPAELRFALLRQSETLLAGQLRTEGLSVLDLH
jgi:hypothetical protein